MIFRFGGSAIGLIHCVAHRPTLTVASAGSPLRGMGMPQLRQLRISFSNLFIRKMFSIPGSIYIKYHGNCYFSILIVNRLRFFFPKIMTIFRCLTGKSGMTWSKRRKKDVRGGSRSCRLTICRRSEGMEEKIEMGSGRSAGSRIVFSAEFQSRPGTNAAERIPDAGNGGTLVSG